jgi:hypothetical protein
MIANVRRRAASCSGVRAMAGLIQARAQNVKTGDNPG